MTQETTNAASVTHGARMATDTPALGLIGLLRGVFGRVKRTEAKPAQDVMQLCRRDLLEARINEARLKRQKQRIGKLTNQAYSVTHSILARGK